MSIQAKATSVTTFIESTPCTLCGETKNTPYRYEQFSLPNGVADLGHNRCVSCEMRYVSPRLNDEGRTYLYDECYDTATVSGRYNVDDSVSGHEYDSFEKYVRKSHPRGGKFLDVGCGVGMLLARFTNDKAFKFEGVEYSHHAADEARTRADVVHVGNIEELGLESNSYDGLTSMYVLEHVAEPLQVLEEIYRLCKPGGTVFLAVPNYRYLRIRSDNPVVRFATRGSATLHAAEHLHNFTPETFETAVARAGFSNIDIEFTEPLIVGSTATRALKQIARLPAAMLASAGYGLGGIHLTATKPRS